MSKRSYEDKQREYLFIKACGEETIEDVSPYIFDCSPNLVHGEKMYTPLIAASMNPKWEEAEKIITFLLCMGALHSIPSKKGETALHISARKGSYGMVKILLEHGHFVDVRTYSDGETPLMGASTRRDEEGLKIAKILLEHKADISIRSNKLFTALHVASFKSTLEMVSLVGPRKHETINAMNSSQETALMRACSNSYHGEEIIPYLISAGANPTLKKDGRITAFLLACRKNASLVRTIRAFTGLITNSEIQNGFSSAFNPKNHADLLGVLRELGMQGPKYFRWAVQTKMTNMQIWTILRVSPPCLDGSQMDYYTVLREMAPKDTRLWDMLASITSGGRHPITGDTTLHASVRTGHAETVAVVFRRLPNPFLRNIAGETPLDVAYGLPAGEEKRKIIVCLKFYSQWKPSNVCADWYGPFFCRRARAFLLVAQRLKVFPRDIVLMILKRVADLEYV